jgi:Arc/MetJ-type ribon-helix-helix transcriptional regulator
MEVRLTPDQEELISRAISSGRLRSAEDAMEEAMSLWEDRERRRTEILAAIDIAEASIAHGKGRIITEQDMQDLAAEVKARGRNQLASERPGPR